MKNLKTLIIFGLVLAILLSGTGCISNESSESSWPLVYGSGNLDTQEMNYSDFTKIEVSHAFQVDISKADSFSVHITLNDNLFEYLIMNITGDTLHIGLEPYINYRNTTEKATITIPDMRGVNLQGASSGNVSGFISANSLQFEVSGASHLLLEDVEAGDTQFNISGASKVSGALITDQCGLLVSGASRVELQGSSTNASIITSGASTLSLNDFVVGKACILLSGTSNATINVTSVLNANLGGVCSLAYSGNPTLGTVIVSESSTMSQK